MDATQKERMSMIRLVIYHFILTVTKTKMTDSKASLALVPNTKLAAIKALHKGINCVPTLTPKAAHTMMIYRARDKHRVNMNDMIQYIQR